MFCHDILWLDQTFRQWWWTCWSWYCTRKMGVISRSESWVTETRLYSWQTPIFWVKLKSVFMPEVRILVIPLTLWPYGPILQTDERNSKQLTTQHAIVNVFQYALNVSSQVQKNWPFNDSFTSIMEEYWKKCRLCSEYWFLLVRSLAWSECMIGSWKKNPYSIKT